MQHHDLCRAFNGPEGASTSYADAVGREQDCVVPSIAGFLMLFLSDGIQVLIGFAYVFF